MASAQGEGGSLPSGDKMRVQVTVPIASVRPPLWRTATREVLETELQRRVAARTEHPSHLPLLGEPLRYRGVTAEEAEAEALRHLREAQDMLRDAESMNAPEHVLDRFRSHAKFMRLQTGESEFRKDKPLPVFILIDGAHWWHVAVSRGEQTIFLSLPRCKEVLNGAVQDLHPQGASSHVRSGGVPEDACPASDHGAPESTERGARVNYLSHLSSPMTVADRVFLLQSWYLGTLDGCEDDSRRTALRDFLVPYVIKNLLALAVREYKDGELCELEAYKKTLSTKADLGQKAVDRAREEMFAFHADGSRKKVPFRLPPIDVVLVAPTASKPRQSLLRAQDVLVNCAIFSATPAPSRILMGLALRAEHDTGRTSSGAPPPNSRSLVAGPAATGTWTISVNGLDSMSRFLSSMDKDVLAAVDVVLGGSTLLTAVDMALMMTSAVRGIEARDLRWEQDFAKGHGGGRKYVRVYEHHCPEKAVLLKSVVEVALTAWLRGAPFGEICKRLTRTQVVVGNARLGLGLLEGQKIDKDDVSFLLRVAPRSGIFLNDHSRLGYADDSGACVKEAHSTRCILLRGPRPASKKGVRKASDGDVPHAESSTEGAPRPCGPGGGGDNNNFPPCDCDFFTETAAEHGMALTHALFLSRRPVSDSTRSKTAAGAVAGMALTHRRGVDKLVRIKNDKQDSRVTTVANKFDDDRSRLEAAKLAHLTEGPDEEEDRMACFVRKKGLLEAVQHQLDSLHALAEEVGLPHLRVLEERFQAAAKTLVVLEKNWEMLGGAFTAYEPEGPDRYYRTEVLALEGEEEEGEEESVVQERPSSTSPSNKVGIENGPVSTEPENVVSRWGMRVLAHKRGIAAMDAGRGAEFSEMSSKRRAAAKAAAAARAADSRGNADTRGAGNRGGTVAGKRKPPPSRRPPPRKRTPSVTAAPTGGARDGLRRRPGETNAGPGKSASDTVQDPSASAAAGGRPAKRRRMRGGGGGGGGGAGGTATGDGRSDAPAPVPGVAHAPPTRVATRGQGTSHHHEGGVTELTGGDTAGAPTRMTRTDAGVLGGPPGEDGSMGSTGDDERRVPTDDDDSDDGDDDDVPGKQQSHGVSAAPAPTPGAIGEVGPDGESGSTGDTSREPPKDVCVAGNGSTPPSAAKETGRRAVSHAQNARGRSRVTAVAGAQVSAGDVGQASGEEEEAGGGHEPRDVDASSAAVDRTGKEQGAAKGLPGEEAEDRTGLAAARSARRCKLDILADAAEAEVRTPTPSSSLEMPSPSVVVASAKHASSSRGQGMPRQGKVLGRGKHEAAKLDAHKQDQGNYYLADVNEHTIPKRVKEAAFAELERLQKRLPVTLASGCTSKWFVTVADLENIHKDHATRGLTRATYRNEGGVVLSRLREVANELERAGVAVIAEAFDSEASRRDIDLVVDTPLHDLKLPSWSLDEGDKCAEPGSHGPCKSLEPIPNPGGGRSQTNRAYWAHKEECRGKGDEALVRASHRHLVRACHIVEEVLACDVRYDDPVRSSSGTPVPEHRCPNTGGRVLVTHPPRRLCDSGGEGFDDDAEADVGALPQKPHVDFPITYRDVRPMCGVLPARTRETAMFVLATGRAGTALRVYIGSHLWASCSPKVIGTATVESEATVVHVPPYSFLMMRGDCFHAGASWLESKWVNDAGGTKNGDDPGFAKGIARWHTYFPTGSQRVSNTVHYAEARGAQFPNTDKHIMLPVNGNVYEGYGEDFSFKMRREK